MSDPVSLPDAETVRRAAAEVIQRREYQLDPANQSDELLEIYYRRLLELFLYLTRWLFQLLEGLPEWLQWVIVVGLFLTLIALVAHMIYSIASLFWGAAPGAGGSVTLAKVTLDPVSLERQAAEAANGGDCSLAVRLLFRACLLRLERAESKKFRGGTTNREVLRRHRNLAVYEPIKLFVDTIENKWYGPGMCSQEDYEACRAAHAALVKMAKGVGDVHDS